VTTSFAGGKGTITFIPRDRYGNQVGPGLAGGFSVGAHLERVVTGAVRDNGDGSYAVPISWDNASGASPVFGDQSAGSTPVFGQRSVEPRRQRWRLGVALARLLDHVRYCAALLLRWIL
jgi:hypothetical protein